MAQEYKTASYPSLLPTRVVRRQPEGPQAECEGCGKKAVLKPRYRSYGIQGISRHSFKSWECEECRSKDDAKFWGIV